MLGWILRRGEIILSAESIEVKRLKELVYRSPDIREDVVADLKTQISGGVYEVKAEHLADKIIRHGICILNALGGNRCQTL